MPALIVVVTDWLSWCCRIQNNKAGGSSSGKCREHWVNPRREETTLVICQLWASYYKLGMATFIVLKWEMQAEPGRSILNTLCWALASGHPEKKPFFLHIELFLTHLIPPASARGLTKVIPPSFWGTGAFYLRVPDVTISCWSPTLRWERCCSSHSISFPLAPGSLCPLLTEDQWNPLRLHTCTSYQRFFSRSNVSPREKAHENSKRILELFVFITLPHHPFIFCDLLFLLTPQLLPLN